MAAEVAGDDVVVVAERLGDAVPVARVVTAAVHQYQGRRVVRAPGPVGQPQPLRLIELLPRLRHTTP